MDKKLNSVALANDELRKENAALWGRVKELIRGAEEFRGMYEALVMQLILIYGRDPALEGRGTTVFLPKIDVGVLMKAYRLEAMRADDGLTLRVVPLGEDESDEDRAD